jgi:acetyltransferase-like isoleucine patch superfamily enzyme
MRKNLSVIIARMRGRATLKSHSTSRLGFHAKIVNLQGRDDAISVGERSIINGELLTFAHGGQLSIGNDCYVGEQTRIWSGVNIKIGNHVLIAHGVSIMDNLTHPINFLARRKHFSAIYATGHPADIDLSDRPIILEDDVWIGAHSIILRGVTIGARSIVSAGSLVRSDVPTDSIVAGNPAVILRSVAPTEVSAPLNLGR